MSTAILSALWISGLSTNTLATEDVEPIVEWEKKQNAEERLEVFGDGFLGDSIDPHTGSLSFSHTDIELPGNSSLSVSLRRQRTSGMQYRDGVDVEFGDWSMQVPRISVTSLDLRPWVGNRCSSSTSEILRPYSTKHNYMNARDYSNGIQVEIPGQGSQQLLDDNGSQIWPSSAKKVTKANWYFTCISSSDGGQGFLGHAPNGDVYRFNHAYIVDAPRMGFIRANPLERNVYIIAATEVKDKYGNWVKYQYDSLNRLKKIYSNDNRVISLGYSGSSKLVRSASAGGETWHFEYTKNSYTRKQWMPSAFKPLHGHSLNKVVRPDMSFWSMNLDDLSASPAPSGRDYCQKFQHTVSITHPYGATGTFTLKDIEHRHVLASQVRRTETCMTGEPEATSPGFGPALPLDNDVTTSTMALIRKEVTGGSIDTAVWTYEYENDKGPSGSSSSDRTNWTKVTAPDAHYTYYHAWVSEPLSGKLVKKETRETSTGPSLRTEDYTYVKESAVGHSYVITYPGPSDSNTPVHTTKIVTTQNGDTFTQESTFNINHNSTDYSYSYPVSQSTKSNVSTTKRTTITEYFHNKSLWKLGLPKKQLVNGRLIQENSYNPKGLKVIEKRNGAFYAEYGYHNDGNFAWVRDGEDRKIYAAEYKRGTPQTVTRADGVEVKQMVDYFGRVISIEDGNGNITAYNRDEMGRLKEVDFPGNWANVRHSYVFGSNPVHTITRSNAKTIITYDSMFRPILVETKDFLTNKSSYVRTQYDEAGRKVFESFPSRSSTADEGTKSEYDGLNRLIKTHETVAPFSQTTISYHGQHKRTVTDSDGYQTHYYHYGYDGPDYKDIKAIHSPMGVFTTIDKNVWGEVVSVNQVGDGEYGSPQNGTGNDDDSDSGNGDSGSGNIGSGGNGTVSPIGPGPITIGPGNPGSGISSASNSDNETKMFTRRYYYNNKRLLCRISEPEVGDTLYQYDNSNWLKAYQKGASKGTSCSLPSGGAKVSLERYDTGLIKRRNYASSSTPDVYFTYDNNNNLKTVQRGGVNWSYSYNNLGLLNSERLSVDGRQYNIDYAYNSAAHLVSMGYPSSKTIRFNPDGLGRARQAYDGSVYYANNISYHPNSTLSKLNYGNGHRFEQTLNASLLPERLTVAKNNIKALDLSYSYDKRKLVTNIKDRAMSGNDRTMDYDALERLTTSTGPWGTGIVEYDTLGNIIRKKLGTRQVNMTYDSNNRLNRAIDSGGIGGTTGDRSFLYDSRGNVTSAGNQDFVYDYADQPISLNGEAVGSYRYDGNMKRVKATVEGKTIYNVFNLAGELIHIDNVSESKRTDYVRAGGITIARSVNNTPTYVHHDSLGSPVSGTDTSGVVQWRERYTPFGLTLDNAAANDDNAGYTGHIKDSQTGLVYMQARYYDPVIGRFYSNDPVDALGHMQRGNPLHGFGRYTYANNNPYKYTDPNGEFPFLQVGAGVIGFAIGAISEAVTNENASFGSVMKAGGVGAAVGVATTFGGGLLGTMAVGAGANGLGEVANQAMDGEFNTGDVIEAAAIGAVGGAVAKTAAKVAVAGRGLPNNSATQASNNMTGANSQRILADSKTLSTTPGNRAVAEVKLGGAYGTGAAAEAAHQQTQCNDDSC